METLSAYIRGLTVALILLFSAGAVVLSVILFVCGLFTKGNA